MTTKNHVLDELRRLSSVVLSAQEDLRKLNMLIRTQDPGSRSVANRVEHAYGMASDLRIRIEVAISHVECP